MGERELGNYARVTVILVRSKNSTGIVEMKVAKLLMFIALSGATAASTSAKIYSDQVFYLMNNKGRWCSVKGESNFRREVDSLSKDVELVDQGRVYFENGKARKIEEYISSPDSEWNIYVTYLFGIDGAVNKIQYYYTGYDQDRHAGSVISYNSIENSKSFLKKYIRPQKRYDQFPFWKSVYKPSQVSWRAQCM